MTSKIVLKKIYTNGNVVGWPTQDVDTFKSPTEYACHLSFVSRFFFHSLKIVRTRRRSRHPHSEPSIHVSSFASIKTNDMSEKTNK